MSLHLSGSAKAQLQRSVLTWASALRGGLHDGRSAICAAMQKPNKSAVMHHHPYDPQKTSVEHTNWGVTMQHCYQADRRLCNSK